MTKLPVIVEWNEGKKRFDIRRKDNDQFIQDIGDCALARWFFGGDPDIAPVPGFKKTGALTMNLED